MYWLDFMNGSASLDNTFYVYLHPRYTIHRASLFLFLERAFRNFVNFIFIVCIIPILTGFSYKVVKSVSGFFALEES